MSNKEEMVQVPASQLQSILEKLDKLEKGQGVSIKPKRVNEHTAKLRLWNDKLVISVEKVYEVLNERTQKYEDKIDLLLKNGEEKEKVTANYLEFLNNATPITVKILEQKAEKVVESAGTTNLVDPKDDRIYPDKTIDLEVTNIHYTSKVEVMEGEFKGEILTINNKFLNI